MAPFYWWGSTASRLEPLRRGSLHFTTKFPEIPGLRQTLKSCLLSLSKTAAIMWNVIHCCEIFLKYDWVRLFPIMPRSYALQQNWKIFVTKMTRQDLQHDLGKFLKVFSWDWWNMKDVTLPAITFSHKLKQIQVFYSNITSVKYRNWKFVTFHFQQGIYLMWHSFLSIKLEVVPKYNVSCE